MTERGIDMTDGATAALVGSGLRSGYGKIPVLHDVSMTVRDGSLTAVIGPNGGGKTTLMKSILGLVTIMAGEIRYRDRRISALEPHEIVELGIGFMPQTANVFPTMTVQENLEMGSKFLARGARAAEIEATYERFPRLKERRRQRARTLSGGERQMLAIGSALLSQPALLILDEPVTGLSPQITDEVAEGIGAINAAGTTILWVVEENPRQVLDLADWVYVMEGGRIKSDCAAAELLEAENFREIFLGV